MEMLHSKNPANGEIIGQSAKTAVEELPQIFKQSLESQKHWATIPVKQRAHHLIQLRETVIHQTDELIDLITKENGKPKFEALTNEILPSVDLLTHFAKITPKLLAKKKISMRIMKHKKSYLQYWPIGVVVVISPWNFPFYLPFAEIIMAVVAGNTVILKPSEFSSLIGNKIQDLFNESGFPPYTVQTVIGDGELGAALIQQKPGKIFFTGSVGTGKKILADAAQHVIPVNLELGGKDAMIVLPDADVDYATSAALWGSFANSGQACASTERIYIHERIAQPFLDLFKMKIEQLRLGPSTAFENDLGPITIDKQKDIYATQILEAKGKDIQIITGGDFTSDRNYYKPTVLMGPELDHLQIQNEETFGPIVTVGTFKSISEVIKKVNQNRYGLTASIITKNHSLGKNVAGQLEVGTVMINEVLYTAGLGETPWGGVKDSGMGRTHSDMGIYEFVHTRHVHLPRSRLFIFKSLWWFPYTPYQFTAFRLFIELYRKHWLDKLRSLPHFLWNIVKLIKEERRL